MTGRAFLYTGSLAALALLGAACGTARRGEPVAGPFVAQGQAEAEGQRVFMAQCHQCHPGGMAGLGPAINDKPLPPWLVKFQVRNGLGAMPAFDRDKIPPGELDALVEYLVALRKHEPAGRAVASR